MEAIRHFRANPKETERLVPFTDEAGRSFYHYSNPIWIEEYCMECHGGREDAPKTISELYDEAFDYQLGDLRGLMSMKLPADFVEDEIWAQRLDNL